jgi:hypothetical protein
MQSKDIGHSIGTTSLASSFYVTPPGSGAGPANLLSGGGSVLLSSGSWLGPTPAASKDAMNGVALTVDGNTIDVSAHVSDSRPASPSAVKRASLREQVTQQLTWLRGRNNHNGMSYTFIV